MGAPSAYHCTSVRRAPARRRLGRVSRVPTTGFPVDDRRAAGLRVPRLTATGAEVEVAVVKPAWLAMTCSETALPPSVGGELERRGGGPAIGTPSASHCSEVAAAGAQVPALPVSGRADRGVPDTAAGAVLTSGCRPGG